MRNISSSRTILFIPHIGTGGGAGFFNTNLLNLLRQEFHVKLGGKYTHYYDSPAIKVALFDKISEIIVPLYIGAKPKATAYWACISILKYLVALVWVNFELTAPSFEKPRVIILTSSIQVFIIPLFRRLIQNCKVVIIVQENISFNSFRGKCALMFLRRADLVISISESWSTHAKSFGLSTIIFKNSYNSNFANCSASMPDVAQSDILYVGGGGKLKGFELFFLALPRFLFEYRLRVTCLGQYDNYALRRLRSCESVSEGPTGLSVVGQVSDIRPFLAKTSLLLLPIASPHFCRPAIEAGFFNRTFVISNLRGMDDFAKPGKNCLAFDAGDVTAFVDTTVKLLGDNDLLEKLATENHRIARSFIENKNNKNIILSAISDLYYC